MASGSQAPVRICGWYIAGAGSLSIFPQLAEHFLPDHLTEIPIKAKFKQLLLTFGMEQTLVVARTLLADPRPKLRVGFVFGRNVAVNLFVWHLCLSYEKCDCRASAQDVAGIVYFAHPSSSSPVPRHS